jgi:hypothetical protein
LVIIAYLIAIINDWEKTLNSFFNDLADWTDVTKYGVTSSEVDKGKGERELPG